MPWARAVLRAAKPARRRARPTAVANASCLPFFAFIVWSPIIEVGHRNYHTPPRHPPAVCSWPQNSASRAQSGAGHRHAGHHARLVSRGRQCDARPTAASAVAGKPSQCDSRQPSISAIVPNSPAHSKCFQMRSRPGLWPGDPAPSTAGAPGKCREFRSQRRQSGSNEVGVHKMNHARILWQIFPRESRFARVIWSGNDDTARRVHSC